MREAQHALHPETRRALTQAQKSIVLLNRRGWSNFLSCKACGKAWECPRCDVALVLHRHENTLACHHCGHRERIPTRCDNCGSLGGRPLRRGHREGRGRAARAARAARLPPRRRHHPDQGRRPGAARALPPGRARAAARHADGRQGARLPGRDARRRAGRRQHAALPRLPRRGAHVRADRAARGARRARPEGWPRVRPDALPRGARDRRRRAARLRRVPRAGARPPPAAALPAVRGPDPGPHDLAGRAGGEGGGLAGSPRRSTSPTPRSSAPRRCSGCATASASSSC